MSELSQSYKRAFKEFQAEQALLPTPLSSSFKSVIELMPVEPPLVGSNPGGALLESTQRKLKLQWEDLQAKHGFDGEHLKWHDGSRFLKQCGAKQKILNAKSFSDNKKSIAAVAGLARARFNQVAKEWLNSWAASVNPRKEALEKRLEDVASSVLDELTFLWAADEWHICWFERECSATLAEGLRELMKPWSARARALEIQHLEDPHLGFPHSLTTQGEINFAAGLQSSYEALWRAMPPLQGTCPLIDLRFRTPPHPYDIRASMVKHRERAAADLAPKPVLSPGSNAKANEPGSAAVGELPQASKGRRGRPAKTESIRSLEAWRGAGAPPLNSASGEFFDSLALELYPKEFNNSKVGSRKRNRLRFRVIQNIRRARERIKMSV